jgi:hypothetical protein
VFHTIDHNSSFIALSKIRVSHVDHASIVFMVFSHGLFWVNVVLSFGWFNNQFHDIFEYSLVSSGIVREFIVNQELISIDFMLSSLYRLSFVICLIACFMLVVVEVWDGE